VRRQGEDGQPATVGLGEHLAGHRRRPVGPAVGQRRGTHRVQPLHEGAAVGGVGGRQPGTEDDEDVGAGSGERIGGVVDHHVPDDAAQPRGAGRDRGTRESWQVEDVLDRQAHPFAPTGALVAHVGPRLGDRPIATERDRLMTMRRGSRRGVTLGHVASSLRSASRLP
jgi:hypothetical protein